MSEKYILHAEAFCKTGMFPQVGRWIVCRREFDNENDAVTFICQLMDKDEVDAVRVASYQRITIEDLKFPSIVKHSDQDLDII